MVIAVLGKNTRIVMNFVWFLDRYIVYINLFILDLDGFPFQSDDSFDKIFTELFGEFENHDVESL